MGQIIKRYGGYRLVRASLFWLVSFAMAGCSSWEIAPKELVPIQVYTYDLVAASATKWTVTFALGGNPGQDPAKAITDVGVCYSSDNTTPSVDDNSTTARTPVLPTSVSIAVTEKVTFYFRAYIIRKDGSTVYSRVGSFRPQ